MKNEIEKSWESLREKVFKGELTSVEALKLQLAFLSGSMTVYRIIREILADEALRSVSDLQDALSAVENEMREFETSINPYKGTNLH